MKNCYTIIIEKLIIEAIIGILDRERKNTQRVEINAKITYIVKDSFLDYISAVKWIKKSLINGKYGLLEEAFEAISKDIKSQFSEVIKIQMSLKKLDIFDECIVGIQAKKSYKTKISRRKNAK